MKVRVFLVVVVGMSAAIPAHADHGERNWLLSIGTSFAERVGAGISQHHLGAYGSIGAGYLWRWGKDFALVPSLGIGYSPDGQRWGFSGGVTVEFHATKDAALDLSFVFVHDQVDGHWREAEFFIGLAPGISFFLGTRVILSVSVALVRSMYVGGGYLALPNVSCSLRL